MCMFIFIVYNMHAMGAPNFTPFSTADPLLAMATSHQMQMTSAPNPPTQVQSSTPNMNSPVNAPIHSGYVGRRRGRDIPPYTGDSLNNSRDYDLSIHGDTSATPRTAGVDVRLDFNTLDYESQSDCGRTRNESTNSNRLSVAAKQKRKRCNVNTSLRATSKPRTPIKTPKKPKKSLPTPLRDKTRYPGLSSDWSSPEFDGSESKKLKTDDKPPKKKTKQTKKRSKTRLVVQIPLNLITAKTAIDMNGDSGFHSNARDVSSDKDSSREASPKEHSDHGNDSPATPESTSTSKTIAPLEARNDDKMIHNSSILALNSVPLSTQEVNGDQNNDDSDITRIEDTQENLLSLLPSRSRSISPSIPLQGSIDNLPRNFTTGEQSQTPIIINENIACEANEHGDYTNGETSTEVCDSYLEDSQKSCDTTMEVQSMFQDKSVFDYSSDLSVSSSVSRKQSRWKKKFLQGMIKRKKCRSSGDVPSSSKMGNSPSTEGKSLPRMPQYQLSHLKSPKSAKSAKNVRKRAGPTITPRRSQTVSEIQEKIGSISGDTEMVIDESLPEQMDTNNNPEAESESPLPCSAIVSQATPLHTKKGLDHTDETQQPECKLDPSNTSDHSNDQTSMPANSQNETTLIIDPVHTANEEAPTKKPSPLTTRDNSPSGNDDSTDSEPENMEIKNEESITTKLKPSLLSLHSQSHLGSDNSSDSETENEAVQEPADEKQAPTTKPPPLKTHDNSRLRNNESDSTDSETEDEEPANGDAEKPAVGSSPLLPADEKQAPTTKPSPLKAHDNSRLRSDDSDSTDSESENEEPADRGVGKPAVGPSPLPQEAVEDDTTNSSSSSDSDTEAPIKTQVDNNSLLKKVKLTQEDSPKSAFTQEKKEAKLSLKLKRPSRKSSDSSSNSTDVEVDAAQRTQKNAIAKTISPMDTSESFSEDEEDSDTSNTPRLPTRTPPLRTKMQSSRFLFTSRARSGVKCTTAAVSQVAVPQRRDGSESSSGSSSCSSDSDEDSGGAGVVGKKRRSFSLASLLQSEGSNAYHPTLHTASSQPQQLIKTKSFSSLKPFKSPSNQVKIDQSEHRVHKRAAIPVREELDDLSLSQQEAAVAKTGSKNLERLLRTEKFWC
ncbi:nucleolar protein dao-5-like isoform X2 [Halichondria panicea]|uniref:nucleolar protein dao-5-like isoform X2 n=1 Tax=Halichondria panicea TaxID=6063 RepID=UPI00312B607A